MKVSRPFLILLLLCFAACSSDSSDSNDTSGQQDQDMPDATDNEAPVISVSGLENVIETYTNLEISITDNSAVETRILVNDQEVYTTTSKQFQYELNPFNIAIGNIDLRIVSEDIFGNASESEFDPEIKHLLMEFNLAANELVDIDNLWAFFNNAAGELLATSALSPGMNKIYTDALIPEDHIYYTFTKYYTYGANVVHTLINESYKVRPGETRYEFDRLIVNRDEELEIEVIREELVNEWSKYETRAVKYWPIGISFTSGPSYSEVFSIEYSYPEIVYLRTAIENAGVGFDGKKENYRYTTLEPNPGMTNMQVTEANFKTMDDHFVQSIPTHDLNSFRFDRRGFENEADMLDNIYHNIYELNEDFFTISEIDVPILPDLPLYNNIAQYSLDGNRIYVRQFGNNLNLEAPTWNLGSYGTDGPVYFIEANNEDVDYYLLRLYKGSATSGPRKSFVWVYRTFGSEDDEKTTPQLEFPEEITNSIGDPFYSGENLVPQYIVAADFEELNSLEDATHYFATGKLSLDINEQGIKSVRFSQSPTSGKVQQQSLDDDKALETNF